MSADVGIVNLSHFAIYDVTGPDHVRFMEYLCVAKGRRRQSGRQGHLYPLPRRKRGMVKADFTVFRLADRFPLRGRGGCRKPRLRLHEAHGGRSGLRRRDHRRIDRLHHHRPLGAECQGHAATRWWQDPDGLSHERFPFASIKQIEHRRQVEVAAFRISYVGEQGWELHMKIRRRPRGLGCASARRASCPSGWRPMPTPAEWRRACASRTRTS